MFFFLFYVELMIYLDNNATAPLRPSALEKMSEALGAVGNPSSTHSCGRKMRKYIEDARADVAMLAGCAPEHVIFTSGGTEAIACILCHFNGEIILTSSIEHKAVLENSKDAIRIPTDANGIIDLDEAEHLIKKHNPKLISAIYASNETGVIQPIIELTKLAHEHDALIHIDAIQAAGKIPLSFETSGADYMSLAAHKIGGPQGTGALIKAAGRPLPRLICGGTQERHQRAGTENVAGIAGFGAAARECLETMKQCKVIESMRDELETFIRSSSNSVRIWGEQAKRVPNTIMLSLNGVPSETLVMIMDLNGVAVGSGAACSSGTVKPSHVLMSMGASEEEATCCMRVSLGWKTSEEDIQKFKDAWLDLIKKIGHKIK
jgi:cysteine desulfurase